MAMEHLNRIKALIQVLVNSDTFHALVVISPPGIGKSTAIDLALAKCNIKPVAIGAFGTSLHIYNVLCRNSNSVILLDDCASVFSDPKTMAILKAATWQSSGNSPNMGDDRRIRRVNWGSTSEKVEKPYTDFSGKIILLTNAVTSGKDTEAFLSRCLSYEIKFTENEIVDLVLEAARSKTHFPDTDLAEKVANFLVDKISEINFSKISLRTLKMGYDLSLTHPESWAELFLHLLPKRTPMSDIKQANLREDEDRTVREILSSSAPVKEQEARFVALTGKSRRTFYLYRKRLGLSRSYQSSSS